MIKVGRPYLDPPCPQGYPYRLYKIDNTFMIGTSRKDVIQKTNSKNVQLVKINDLISEKGYSSANATLKELGDKWVCKEGNIFYGN